MIYFTYCMNFCKCHMYPQHNNKKYQWDWRHNNRDFQNWNTKEKNRRKIQKISLMIRIVGHFFIYLLVICRSSFQKCLFRSSAHFSIGLFTFLLCLLFNL
jgi:hypothetical protein